MHFLRLLITCALIVLGPVVSTAQAINDEQKGFWQNGAATDWKTPVQPTSSKEIVYRDYPVTVDAAKLRIQKEAKEAVEKAQNAINESKQEIAQSNETPPKEPLSREQILAKYGPPTEPHPIRAQKDSPPELQALFEALNTGDKELAWQYSVALAERNNRLKDFVAKATDYQLLAMEATGQRPEHEIDPETDAVGSTRLELRDLIEKTKLERLQKKFEADRKLLESGEGADEDLLNATGRAASESSQVQVPVDPDGVVKLLIFFDEKDPKVNELSSSLKPLQEKFKEVSNVSILGLTMRSYAVPGLKRIGATTSFPFPLVNGEALAPELRIQRYPSFVFVAVTSRQTYYLEGAQEVGAIERVLNIMRGAEKRE